VPRPGLDFAYLTDPLVQRLPSWPALRPLAGVLAATLPPSHWGTVTFRPNLSTAPGGRPPSATGTIVLIRDSGGGHLVDGCLRRTRRARGAGARLLALGGRLAGQEALALELATETGLAVSLGVTLEAVATLEAALTLLRWRGVDPPQARAVVLAEGAVSGAAEALVEYLGERVGRIGVHGLSGFRRLTLAERMRTTSGAALEVYRSVERCLLVADLLVVAGETQAEVSLPEFDPGVRAGYRTAVIVNLSPSRSAAAAARSGLLETVVQLGGLGPAPELKRGVGLEFKRRTGRGLSGGKEAGETGLAAIIKARAGPVELRGVLFARPGNWSGRAEPGAPDGLLSAPLAEAAARVWALGGSGEGPRRGERPAGPKRALSPRAMTWMDRWARSLGLRPAALITVRGGGRSLTGGPGDTYNRLDLPGK
jgi:hypothetical protein